MVKEKRRSEDLSDVSVVPQSQVQESDIDDDDIEELLDFEDEFDSWLSGLGGDDGYYKVNVLKLDTNKGKRWFVCDEYESELPSISDLRMRFGGGAYRILIKAKDKRGQKVLKTRRINIADDLTQRESVRSVQPVPQQVPQPDPVEKLSALIRAVEPLFRAQQVPQQTIADPFNMVQRMSEAMGKMYENQFDFVNKAQKRVIEMEREAVADSDNSSNGFDLNSILEMAKGFLPMILSSGPAGTQVAKTVANNAAVKKVLQDQKKTQLLIAEFEKEFGKEKTAKALKKLGISRE